MKIVDWQKVETYEGRKVVVSCGVFRRKRKKKGAKKAPARKRRNLSLYPPIGNMRNAGALKGGGKADFGFEVGGRHFNSLECAYICGVYSGTAPEGASAEECAAFGRTCAEIQERIRKEKNALYAKKRWREGKAGHGWAQSYRRQDWKDGSWHYELTFDIFDGEGWMADSGTPAASRYVILQENDYSPVIADVNLPEKLAPDSSVATKVVLRNAGVSAWPGKKTGVGYHWYTLDGKEVYTETNPTVLAKDFAPGMAVVFEGVNIKTPSEAGDYVLVMDMMFDGKYFSESCFSENNDILVRKVKVGE
ncbi:MAG: hypothetical protein IJT09_03040 [Abditibacteriota bacterium]|nr:hypothetical protein [Abditibacteriota bacterium]